ncbi:MAG: ATP-dependent DNA helicase RecQ [Prevotella sp.]
MNEALEVLEKYWGYKGFRGVQEDIIKSILDRKDTLGLMPTGGGKSITFQVPAMMLQGTCVVITPLVALMKDQVMNLKRRGIKAAAIHSGLSREQILTILENAVFDAVKILYVSPERLSSELFRKKLSHITVSFIAVDEAHCISQWGYDFRPAYLEIANIRTILPDPPILALTATATPPVVKDIQQRLLFKRENVFKMSFERKNLAYCIRHVHDKHCELVHILQCIKGSSIVYTRSRMRAKETAQMLNEQEIKATYYHAGLEDSEKDRRQKQWLNGEYRVMVATNAFGMGIDKPDVRTVIHIDCPDCIENYFQEAGRGGRDGLPSYAVLLYNDSDNTKLTRRIQENFPDKEYIRKVYDDLACFYQIASGSGYNETHEFDMGKFCVFFHHFPIQLTSALHILTRAGYIEYIEEGMCRDRVRFMLTREQLYLLEETSAQEEKVFVALLRSYSGLFSDYADIELSLLSEITGLTRQQLYLTLQALDKRHILHYIPAKDIPHIRYTQNREESKHIVIGKEVYDDRKKTYSERIKKIIQYANNDTICRSRLLLNYFGETNTDSCGICDTCRTIKKEQVKEAKKAIAGLLEGKELLPIESLKQIKMPSDVVDKALAMMIEEGTIRQNSGSITH